MTRNSDGSPWSAHDIRAHLALVGVNATAAEATALAVQAVPYAAMLDRLTAIPAGTLEPAVVFTVDDWPSAGDA